MSNFNFKPCHLLFGIDLNSKKEKDVDIILNYALFTIYKSLVGKEFKKKRTKERLLHISIYLLDYRLQGSEVSEVHVLFVVVRPSSDKLCTSRSC